MQRNKKLLALNQKLIFMTFSSMFVRLENIRVVLDLATSWTLKILTSPALG